MNYLFISDDDPGNRYLLRQVAQQIPIGAVIRPVWTPSPNRKSLVNRFLQAPLKALLSPLSNAYHRKAATRLREAIAETLLESDESPDPTYEVIEIPAWQLNHKASVAKIKALEPDIIIVSGAPLLKPRIFEIPRLGTINLHFGISPDYRGHHTLFWPLMEGDYSKVGATIHYIDRGVDTGPILAQVYPALEPEDTEISVEIKTRQLVTQALIQFLQTIEEASPDRPLPGWSPDASGRLIQHRDRSILVDFTYRLRRRLGQLKPTKTTERIEVFYQHDRPTQSA